MKVKTRNIVRKIPVYKKQEEKICQFCLERRFQSLLKFDESSFSSSVLRKVPIAPVTR